MQTMKRSAAGRPPKYESVEEITGMIEQYFDSCQGHYLKDSEDRYVMDRAGRPIKVEQKPPTITGLARALGFATRRSLSMYQAKAEFQDVITRAKARVEMFTEEKLFNRNTFIGAQFSLRNNFQWGHENIIEEQEPAYTQIYLVDGRKY